MLDAVPDQDSFYTVVDSLEELEMEKIILVSVASPYCRGWHVMPILVVNWTFYCILVLDSGVLRISSF